VNDAIPLLVHYINALTCSAAYNSDDAENVKKVESRRQLQAVKYGNISEEDVEICNLKSSKILLHIDDGSIKTGKGADVVLWRG
jgi:hypothetical protein